MGITKRIGLQNSTETKSQTFHSGTSTLPSIGNAFMYIKSSSKKSATVRVFCSFEQKAFIQISKIFKQFLFSNSRIKQFFKFN